ncbi:hypothetical protein BaRGS_00031803, partial [Batillaria attramentaria]
RWFQPGTVRNSARGDLAVAVDSTGNQPTGETIVLSIIQLREQSRQGVIFSATSST